MIATRNVPAVAKPRAAGPIEALGITGICTYTSRVPRSAASGLGGRGLIANPTRTAQNGPNTASLGYLREDLTLSLSNP